MLIDEPEGRDSSYDGKEARHEPSDIVRYKGKAQDDRGGEEPIDEKYKATTLEPTLKYHAPVLKQSRPLLGCFRCKASRIPRHGSPSTRYVMTIDPLRSSDTRARIK